MKSNTWKLTATTSNNAASNFFGQGTSNNQYKNHTTQPTALPDTIVHSVNPVNWAPTTQLNNSVQPQAVPTNHFISGNANKPQSLPDSIMNNPIHLVPVLPSSSGKTQPVPDLAALRPPYSGPNGLLWDRINWSCGYDAMLTPLTRLWEQDKAKWTPIFLAWNRILAIWITNLANTGRTKFPFGPTLLKIDNLFEATTSDKAYGTAAIYCETYYQEPITVYLQYCQIIGSLGKTRIRTAMRSTGPQHQRNGLCIDIDTTKRTVLVSVQCAL
ncbi:hypothetical protein R3P38DRAFT_2781373 [Favolaschia claudopus]|uniref:Uncharacterized protein n=1 Tax=Favolaschia claudopus TaxID=2862362 RepID=A0AAW0B8C2_9AGAR